ncbi:MAG: bifunctional DNA-formamidopyrimidine glycosylase/DNA-(apurinic or apyrimidinic site) lyase [Chloroflexi bacterium]|nr:bifunctional DNA-formamidopyrimidine glycosylase/DNA-(apurinic or apyrimidinic site) lyase [Chloroflexota bacterium]
MPELPEVETIARALRQGGRGAPAIAGAQITAARLLWPRTLAEPDGAGFLGRVAGQRIEAVGRRGKFVRLQLTRDWLLIHLRMTGDLRVEAQCDPDGSPLPLAPHDRLVLDFAGGYRLAFNDARKFGRVWLVDDPETILGGLGPEPLDEALTPAVFYANLHARRRQLKPLLLDQSFLAGMGNIYTDEALHVARLHPLQPSERLNPAQAGVLLDSIRTVLLEGIRHNGASIDWAYRGGNFQNTFRVYQRTGEACPVCGATIQRTVIGQRGTHFCPVCQVLKDDGSGG